MGPAVKLSWPAEGDVAVLTSSCRLTAGVQLSDALLMIQQSSHDILCQYGPGALRHMQVAQAGLVQPGQCLQEKPSTVVKSLSWTYQLSYVGFIFQRLVIIMLSPVCWRTLFMTMLISHAQ